MEKFLIFKLKADRYKPTAKHCEVIHNAFKITFINDFGNTILYLVYTVSEMLPMCIH